MKQITFSRRNVLRVASALFGSSLLPWEAARATSQASLFDVSQWGASDVSKAFQEFAQTRRMPPALNQWLNDPAIQCIEPYRVFDNVWNVGINWVSAYLIRTTEGWVLLDTLHEPFVDRLFENIKSVGVNLDEIKLVLMTHGHFDHVGGYYKLRPVLKNAKFVMSERGWKEAIEYARKSQNGKKPWKMDETIGVVAKDGDQFKLGANVFTLLETPGHTWGTSSYTYFVEYAGQTHRALTIGGQGLNAIEGIEQIDAYIASMKRLSEESLGIDVDLTAHPFSTGLADLISTIRTLKATDTHPLVNRQAYLDRLDRLVDNAEKMRQTLLKG